MRRVWMAGAMDGVRAYFRELRARQGITQQALADAIQLSLRALQDWENGRTDDMKGAPLFRAVAFLHASLSDVQLLVNTGASEEEGRQRALLWLSADEQQRIDQLVEEDDDDALMAAIQEMRAELDRLEKRVDARQPAARSDALQSL